VILSGMYSLMFWLGILLPDLWEIPSLNYQSITSGATEAMNVTLDEFEFGSKYLQSRGAASLSSFTQSLGTDFLKVGEAKWWDAH
jgi:hypothetical protein